MGLISNFVVFRS